MKHLSGTLKKEVLTQDLFHARPPTEKEPARKTRSVGSKIRINTNTQARLQRL